jgi:hypothetical protein
MNNINNNNNRYGIVVIFYLWVYNCIYIRRWI